LAQTDIYNGVQCMGTCKHPPDSAHADAHLDTSWHMDVYCPHIHPTFAHSPLCFIPLHPISPNRNMHCLSFISDVIYICNMQNQIYTQLTKIHENCQKNMGTGTLWIIKSEQQQSCLDFIILTAPMR